MINWKIHPRAVAANVTYLNDEDKTVAFERVDRPTQKTVADAVGQKKVDISEMRDGMTVRCIRADSGCYKVGERYSVGRDEDGYFGPLNEKGLASFNHQAYSFELVEDGEQEGERWTHTYGEHRCFIKVNEPDLEGYIVVVTEYNGYIPCKAENLKPIKPTISKAEAWDKLLQTDERIRKLDDAIFSIADKYEII